MKKKISSISLLILLCTALPVFADPSEVWGRLYKKSESLEQKEMVLRNIVRINDRETEGILLEALEEMNRNQEKFKGSRALTQKWISMTDMIVKALGEMKTMEAGDAVWFVVNHPAGSSLLKANALMALGSMRALEFAPKIAIMLRNLNFNTQTENKGNAEIEAYGCVMALEGMHDAVGFEPVFYAASGWYSRRTRELAKKALVLIARDPTDQVFSILKKADYKGKSLAVSVENASSASSENKCKVGILALDEGLRYKPNNLTEKSDLTRLRKEAIQGLIANKNTDAGAVPLLKKVLERSDDSGEVLSAIYLLGQMASDEAVQVLAERLSFFNERQAADIQADRLQLDYIRQMIKSMGMAGNPAGMGALAEVEFSNYTPAIVRLAKKAMKEIK